MCEKAIWLDIAEVCSRTSQAPGEWKFSTRKPCCIRTHHSL